MRIAINTRFLIKNKLEGLGWHNYELCKALVKAHPEDEFFFLFDRPFDPSFIFAENVRGIVVPPPARMPELWTLWFEWSLPLLFSWLKPDVFLSPDSYCSVRTKVPTLMIMHDIAYKHYPNQVPKRVLNFYSKNVPKYVQRADHIIAISDFGKQDLLNNYQLNPEKISVAPNALKGSFYALEASEKEAVRREYSDGKPYFFYIGAIHPRKNLERLIRAFDLFKRKQNSEVKLLIGGRFAWQTGAIKEAYEQAQFKAHIQFLGYLSEEELPKILGAALALTYVSLFEGFGLPILEAMHAEVPIITSNSSSMPEVAGKAALLVDPLKEEEIAKAMEDLFLSTSLSQELVEAGKQERQRFSWKKSAALIYKQLTYLISY